MSGETAAYVALLVGVPGFVLACAFGTALSPVSGSGFVVAALGVALAALYVVTGAAATPEECDPCSDIGGRSFDSIGLLLAGTNLAGWLLGTWTGTALGRRLRSS